MYIIMMEAHIAPIAADSARVNARHALAAELRVVRHKYAIRIAAHAGAMERHKHKLVRLHARIRVNTESIAIASPDFKTDHAVGFDAHDSIAEQQQDTNTGGAVSGAGFANVFQMANDMANRAGRGAACSVPPPRHSE
jgi:hypothetical protein